jgi:hypothetical protein
MASNFLYAAQQALLLFQMNCHDFLSGRVEEGGRAGGVRAQESDGCVALFGRDVIESFSFRRIMPDDQYEGETQGPTPQKKGEAEGGDAAPDGLASQRLEENTTSMYFGPEKGKKATAYGCQTCTDGPSGRP